MIFSIDKLRAVIKSNKNRISERILLLISFIGGFIGAIFAMIIFRHKIKKISFMVKFIFIVMLELIIGNYYFNNTLYIEFMNIFSKL
jgi:uncharacterized membrane protein YsdA (DUF1294 family)